MSVAPLLSAGTSPLGTDPTGKHSRAAAALALGGNKKALAALPQDQQVKAVAGQFEAILLRQFLQDSVGKIMGGESGERGQQFFFKVPKRRAVELGVWGCLRSTRE